MALRSFEKAQKLWERWNLRGAVLASLLLQIFLILSASERKRSGRGLLTMFIWLAYLLADWVAAFAVGLISSGQGNDCPNKNSVSKDVAAFWAPFLLLHLGGPDNITAFALEDNQLWLRHLFGLLIQILAVLYVFTQSAPNDFWIPTVILTIAGAIKYGERSLSLYSSCLSNLKTSLLPKPDAGPNYAQLMEEYSSMHAAHIPVNIETVSEETNEKGPSINARSDEGLGTIAIYDHAYEFYKIFRGLIVDHMFSFQERQKSRSFFSERKFEEVFRIMEIELNFMYDVLYTKSVMVHNKFWFLVRLFCSALLAVSFERFVHQRHNIHRFDLAVSYTLLIGAVILDFAGHLKLIFSDWTIVLTKNSQLKSLVSAIHEKLSFGKRRRWCNAISQLSLIDSVLNNKYKWLIMGAKFIGLDALLYLRPFKKGISMEDNLFSEIQNFIFDEIKKKAKHGESIRSAKEIYSARGEWVLSRYSCHYDNNSITASVSEEVDYDESVLLWHIATELCYYTSTDDRAGNREKCVLMSEYMLYLLVMRPTMMSVVAGILQIRFQDTCAEADKYFRRGQEKSKIAIFLSLRHFFMNCYGYFKTKLFQRSITSDSGAPNEQNKASDADLSNEQRKEACEKLLEVIQVDKLVKPVAVKGDRSKSVLFDACILANDLNKLENDIKWEIMSRVWVELLCYAASHCMASSHAKQLSKGGELVTFVWLLMAHFGLGDQFRIEAGHARAKLIVGK